MARPGLEPGGDGTFDRALERFALAYADQTTRTTPGAQPRAPAGAGFIRIG